MPDFEQKQIDWYEYEGLFILAYLKATVCRLLLSSSKGNSLAKLVKYMFSYRIRVLPHT